MSKQISLVHKLLNHFIQKNPIDDISDNFDESIKYKRIGKPKDMVDTVLIDQNVVLKRPFQNISMILFPSKSLKTKILILSSHHYPKHEHIKLQPTQIPLENLQISHKIYPKRK